MENPDFMTVSEVANMLKLSRVTVNRLIHKNELKAHKFGKLYRIQKEEVKRYLDASATSNEKIKNVEKEEFSTAKSLMKHFGTWVGDDADKVLKYILDNRTKAKF
ncbi:MAG: binding protein excisionase family [Candidatus Poribacteria bacterium]|nr:binding protein excisionase family [Candidatus Poribacteria bacterium]